MEHGLYKLDVTLSRGWLGARATPEVILQIMIKEGLESLQLSSSIFAMIRDQGAEGEGGWREYLVQLDERVAESIGSLMEQLNPAQALLELEGADDTSESWTHYQLVYTPLCGGVSRLHQHSARSSGLIGRDALAFSELVSAALRSLVESSELCRERAIHLTSVYFSSDVSQ